MNLTDKRFIFRLIFMPFLLVCILVACSTINWLSPERSNPMPIIVSPSDVGPTLVGPTNVGPTPDQAVLIPTQIPTEPADNLPNQTGTLSPAPSPVPTQTPILRQLTTGGCCVQPFWSPDGQRVLFLDRPSSSDIAGIWASGLEGSIPELFTDRLGLYSGDMQWLAFPQGGETIVERVADGQRWTIPSGGRAISFSPDNQYVAWTAGQSGPPFDTAQRQVWVSQVDGSQARALLTVYGGGFSGWLPDGRLLVSGRPDPGDEQQGFWSYSLQDGEMIELVRASRFRGASVSPGGTWLAYQITFSMETTGSEQSANGLWIVHTATGEKMRLELFGAYRWQDDQRLLVIPLDVAAPTHRLYQVDAATGAVLPITDPEITPFKVANGDWTVSPDGRTIAFVSAEDYNIWVLSIPMD